jgi:hypothetical protein
VVKETTIQELSPGERPRYPEMPWESQCTQEAARQFLDDASAVIAQLHEWAGLDPFLLFSPETGSRTVAPVDEASRKAMREKKRSSRK